MLRFLFCIASLVRYHNNIFVAGLCVICCQQVRPAESVGSVLVGTFVVCYVEVTRTFGVEASFAGVV